MSIVFVCIGNGVRADGTPSNISRAIVEKALQEKFIKIAQNWGLTMIIFAGGYKNQNGVTEAEAMLNYAIKIRPELKNIFYIENNSYRTHNNAIKTMLLLRKLKNTIIYIFDHPLHLERTLLVFRTVKNKFFPNFNFNIVGIPVEEVYDEKIPGQPYWASRHLFIRRERKAILLYKIFLFPLWAKIGLCLLTTIWQSHKQ